MESTKSLPPLRVLLVEDSEDDAELLRLELRRVYKLSMDRVESAQAMQRALNDQEYDIVISDHVMPRFSSTAALAVLKASGKVLPFIIVSGTIGEELAVAAMKAGASDYVLKGNLARLLPAIEREVADAEVRRRAEHEAKESEERFRATFSQAAVGIAQVAPDGRWLRVNQRLCDIVGYSEAELLGKTFQDITYADDLESDLEYVRQILADEIRTFTMEKRYIRKDGTLVWINLTVSLVRAADGSPKYFISVIEDITRRKATEAQLMHLATHDHLTHLPNRSLLQDRITQAIAHAERAERQMAVLFLDLDRFKNINDSLGHDVGDKLIIVLAERLRGIVRGGDTVARVGGDEFVLVITELQYETQAENIARKVLEVLAEPEVVDGTELFLCGSIGISLYPRDGRDCHTLLKNADAAMYRAKEAGRNQFQFFTQEMNANAVHRLTLENELRHALEREEFSLHYQPQIDLANGAVVGMEALLRWHSPTRGMVPPAEFIPLAEESGLIVPIGEWVLRTACAQNKAWLNAGMQSLRVAVNISARQCRLNSLTKLVERVLADTGLDACHLELEITESLLMDNPEESASTLRDLNQMGIQLAIDDFGTGYSSLSYLKRFPIHTLKIDQSFVRDITTDPDDAAIVKAVIAMARSLKLRVVAEGVETVEQLEFLRAHECEGMQGYYFSKPMPTEQFAPWLDQWQGV
ncbi:MAG: EAL domain-containing protein [Burkholderiales bacterium]|nr:EAL domain-containing protein [Burkholderiales bacterium]